MFAGQEVDAQESFGLRMHIIAGIRMYENYFAQQAIGTMVQEDWRAIREIIKLHFRFPAYREAFSVIESGLNREFASEVRKIIDELDREAS